MTTTKAAGHGDEYWMAQALALAKRGQLTTTPNPNVGCVIVKDNRCVGSGYHQKAGTGHAEVHALAAAGEQANGATAYVTLEPCSHYGRTPPCADALINAGVSRVVCAMTDPNPQVAGQGLAKLQAAGIEVRSELLREQAEQLNCGFLKRMRTGLPWLRLKMAASLDGGTALANGDSQWITGPEARHDVQHWRACSCAIVTGVETILADDPSLNVRLAEVSRQPVRVILDSHGRTPVDAKLLNLPGETWVVHGAMAEPATLQALQQAGAKTQQLPLHNGRIDLPALMAWAGQQQWNSLWLEAGATLAGAFMAEDLVDEILLYQAPLLLGANTRPTLNIELASLNDGIQLQTIDIRFVGKDLRWQLQPVTTKHN